jgi:hypothetical protein
VLLAAVNRFPPWLSYAYEHTCTFGLFMACRKNLKLKST